MTTRAKQRTALGLAIALVALAAPTFAADRTVNAPADAPTLGAFEALPVVAFIQVGPVTLVAVQLPAEPGEEPAETERDSDKDEEGKNSVILEDGAPF